LAPQIFGLAMLVPRDQGASDWEPLILGRTGALKSMLQKSDKDMKRKSTEILAAQQDV